MKIGSWGRDIVFTVSSRKVLTFENLKRTVSNRWASHTPIYGKPKKEFQGPDLDQVTLTISLNALLGIKVEKELKKIESAVRTGKANYLVIGGKRVGTGKYVITNISETWETFLKKGRPMQIDLNISFTEYR